MNHRPHSSLLREQAVPIRYIVIHRHWSGNPDDQVEEGLVSYSTAMNPSSSSSKPFDQALSYAINTASRYNGTIYADYGEGEGKYELVRRYNGSNHDSYSRGTEEGSTS